MTLLEEKYLVHCAFFNWLMGFLAGSASMDKDRIKNIIGHMKETVNHLDKVELKHAGAYQTECKCIDDFVCLMCREEK